MGSSVAASPTTLLLLSILLLLTAVIADPVEDKQALLDFVSQVRHIGRRLNWDPNSTVCGNWIGVTCSGDLARVVAVRLPGVGLSGQIPPITLSRLASLQTLSLRNNALSGPFPTDFANLTSLTDLHLQANGFSGPLPSDFSQWKSMTALDLSLNSFNGTIPSSISNLTQLSSLNLSNNSLSGPLPDLNLPNLKQLNLSNNGFDGDIPKSLQNFPTSSFSGNKLNPITHPSTPSLSPAPPVVTSSPPPPASIASPTKAKRKLSESAILGIIVGGCALGFVILATLLILCCSRRKDENVAPGKKLGKGDRSPEKAATAYQDSNNRLVFFEGCNFAFDLEDLLRASAEVLGKGMFGTAYRASLEDNTMVVVKRLKDVGVGRKEFEQQMEVVGRVKHENVVELRAYYYSKDEKLMVYDYYSFGSVSSMLHAKRGEDRTPLDWESRIKIALGAARGIAHVHTQNNGKLIHGNIKSSNVFLNHNLYGCVSDVGLTTLMSPTVPPVSRAAGYRAPEVTDTRRATQMSDTYSFGVLLLELLTGKSPIHVTGGGDEVVHLVRWVQSVVREEWTAEVFDVELMRYPNIEEEMVEMLQIAMSCVVRVPEQRPKIASVVKMIEDVRKMDTGNRPSSEARSEDSSGLTPAPLPGQASTSFSVEAPHQK